MADWHEIGHATNLNELRKIAFRTNGRVSLFRRDKFESETESNSNAHCLQNIKRTAIRSISKFTTHLDESEKRRCAIESLNIFSVDSNVEERKKKNLEWNGFLDKIMFAKNIYYKNRTLYEDASKGAPFAVAFFLFYYVFRLSFHLCQRPKSIIVYSNCAGSRF